MSNEKVVDVPKQEVKVGNCPGCGQHDVVRGEGRLDQSGEQYLPCVTWTCGGLYGGCGYKNWERPADGTVPLCYFPPESYKKP